MNCVIKWVGKLLPLLICLVFGAACMVFADSVGVDQIQDFTDLQLGCFAFGLGVPIFLMSWFKLLAEVHSLIRSRSKQDSSGDDHAA